VNDPRPDAELRERFQQLRSEDRSAAPDFAALIARVRDGSPEAVGPAPVGREAGFDRPWWWARRWVWAAGSLAAAAAVAAVMVFHPAGRADREFERTVRAFAAASGGWRTPTDVLLDIPGSEITRTVPRVGVPDGMEGLNGAARRNRS
jgi:hypothetical protein